MLVQLESLGGTSVKFTSRTAGKKSQIKIIAQIWTIQTIMPIGRVAENIRDQVTGNSDGKTNIRSLHMIYYNFVNACSEYSVLIVKDASQFFCIHPSPAALYSNNEHSPQ